MKQTNRSGKGIRNLLLPCTLLLTIAVAASCGAGKVDTRPGGGTGGGTGGGGAVVTQPTAPSPTLSYGIKQLQFSWQAVSGATYYRLSENPDGTSGFTQVGSDITTTSVNHDIALHRRLNASYIISACNSAGCTDSAPLSLAANLNPAIGYVKSSNTGTNDWFGCAVALSSDGTTLAVGARYEDSSAAGIDGDQADNSIADSGAVYIFTRTSGTWSQQAYVKASNTGTLDYFGHAVALSADGNTLAVGAYGENSRATGIDGDGTDNLALGSGAVYVFTRTGGTWSQQAYIKASNTGSGDWFGYAVALSSDGNTLAAGAPTEASNATGIGGDQTDNSAAGGGAVYVFARSAGIWSQQAYVKASNTGAGDYFGSAVALSADGGTVAVGAYGEDSSATGIDGDQASNSTANSGAVYVFTRLAGIWSQQAYVKASNTGASDNFGKSVSLSSDGSTLAAGADGEDSIATGIGGDQADNSAANSGAVYVFARSAGIWSQQAYVKSSNTGASDYFGYTVALSSDGNTLAAGSYYEDSIATGIGGDQADNSAANSGAVYVFTLSAGTWTQQAYVKASNTGASDYFGKAVALSSDGNTLAAGAYAEDSIATGIGGDQTDNSASSSGGVYLY